MEWECALRDTCFAEHGRHITLLVLWSVPAGTQVMMARHRIVLPGGIVMPMYEYECGKCQNTFTVALSFKEHEQGVAACPGCGSKKVRQLISSFIAKTASKT
jgi:putative FmdB family regulatory protein